jgi:ribosomal protein L31
MLLNQEYSQQFKKQNSFYLSNLSTIDICSETKPFWKKRIKKGNRKI